MDKSFSVAPGRSYECSSPVWSFPKACRMPSRTFEFLALCFDPWAAQRTSSFGHFRALYTQAGRLRGVQTRSSRCADRGAMCVWITGRKPTDLLLARGLKKGAAFYVFVVDGHRRLVSLIDIIQAGCITTQLRGLICREIPEAYG